MAFRLTLLGSTVAIVAAAAAWIVSSPHPASRVLLCDVAFVALATAFGILAAQRRHQPRWLAIIPWISSGALLGAAAIGAPGIAGGASLAAAIVGISGVIAGLGGPRGALTRFGVVAAAAVCNLALLWPFVLGRYTPVSPTEFQSRHYRVHTFLEDVPLHDVWIIRLRGGDTVTREHIEAILTGETFRRSSPIVVGLLALRNVLGGVFGWDEATCEDPASSFAHRLSDTDRRESVKEPEANGFLYTFEREALAEIYNCTVHAFLAWAWEPAADGHKLYWAIYVKPVGDLTPTYMALIDPFRRLFVYPTIIRRIEQRWAARYGGHG